MEIERKGKGNEATGEEQNGKRGNGTWSFWPFLDLGKPKRGSRIVVGKMLDKQEIVKAQGKAKSCDEEDDRESQSLRFCGFESAGRRANGFLSPYQGACRKRSDISVMKLMPSDRPPNST